jgi:hypothetical protein
MAQHNIKICGLAETNTNWEYQHAKAELIQKAKHTFQNSTINFSVNDSIVNTAQDTNQEAIFKYARITGQAELLAELTIQEKWVDGQGINIG